MPYMQLEVRQSDINAAVEASKSEDFVLAHCCPIAMAAKRAFPFADHFDMGFATLTVGKTTFYPATGRKGKVHYFTLASPSDWPTLLPDTLTFEEWSL